MPTTLPFVPRRSIEALESYRATHGPQKADALQLVLALTTETFPLYQLGRHMEGREVGQTISTVCMVIIRRIGDFAARQGVDRKDLQGFVKMAKQDMLDALREAGHLGD